MHADARPAPYLHALICAVEVSSGPGENRNPAADQVASGIDAVSARVLQSMGRRSRRGGAGRGKVGQDRAGQGYVIQCYHTMYIYSLYWESREGGRGGTGNQMSTHTGGQSRISPT